jgi:hypothetical protein
MTASLESHLATGPLDEFLISSVRDADTATIERLREYVHEQAEKGIRVHLPYDHTKQDGDPNGLYICLQNKSAMQQANRVTMMLDPKSTGSVFDFGMAFLAKKSFDVIGIVNEDAMDDYSRFIMDYDRHGNHDLHPRFEHAESDAFFEDLMNFRRRIYDARFAKHPLSFTFVKDKPTLARFGMLFMAGRPFELENIDELDIKPHKDYNNVAIALHQLYR